MGRALTSSWSRARRVARRRHQIGSEPTTTGDLLRERGDWQPRPTNAQVSILPRVVLPGERRITRGVAGSGGGQTQGPSHSGAQPGF